MGFAYDIGLNTGGVIGTHVYEVLVEAFGQVIDEGFLAGEVLQQHRVLDTDTVPGPQVAFHTVRLLVRAVAVVAGSPERQELRLKGA